jgi:hypothetical protein
MKRSELCGALPPRGLDGFEHKWKTKISFSHFAVLCGSGLMSALNTHFIDWIYLSSYLGWLNSTSMEDSLLP